MRAANLLFLLLLVLNACSLLRDSDEPDGSNCVPYARHISGVQIYGDAHQWWQKADGIYAKGHLPKPGAVLVLSKTNRLRYGHLAVVNKILGTHLITIDHANWWPGKISRDMKVRDVSPGNDWSQLQFWNADASAFGKVYPALGFIYPTRSAAARSTDNSASFCLLKGAYGN